MKSLNMLAGTAALVLTLFALAPVSNAALMRVPLSCNQQLVNCIDQATETFDCCAYAADPTTDGLLTEYCTGEPAAFDAPAVVGTPAAPAGSSVGACLLIFNGTTTACNVAYGICELTHPSSPAAK